MSTHLNWQPAREPQAEPLTGRFIRLEKLDPRQHGDDLWDVLQGPDSDAKLWDYPWLYATQTGWWNLSDEEVKRLREYLLRGGFLMTDDFWGDEQWEVFRRTMERVLPGHPLTDIEEDDSVMHVLYDIREKDRTIIPGSRHLRPAGGGGMRLNYPPGSVPAWRALYDGKGRLVVAANYNTDIGDAWEFADVPYYPEAMTTLAYRYGINYVVYAMTH